VARRDVRLARCRCAGEFGIKASVYGVFGFFEDDEGHMLWLRKWRRRRLGERPFPQQWLAVIQSNVPYYRKLGEQDKRQLQRHVLIFLAEKRFEGCGGLEITDEIRVTVAAQACILLLGRETDYYPGLSTILVYPQAYVARGMEHLGGGVLIEGPHVRLGESWRRGSVVLSWDDVRRGTADIHDGHNVVFHEFAHQLDSSGGRGDGSSVLQYRSNFITWARVLHRNYEQLRRDVRSNQQTLLDKYGATNPAEFFAVATENFFERAKELQRLHPDLYNELRNFYHQDPAGLAD
jgi:Mlc titration factor MtfA (ptsG expression regulator)